MKIRETLSVYINYFVRFFWKNRIAHKLSRRVYEKIVEELKNVLLAFFLTTFRDSSNCGNFFSREKFPLTSEIYYIASSEVRENVLLHKHVYGVKKCTSNYDRERRVFRANKPSSVLEFPYRSLYLSGSVSLFHHYLSSNCSISSVLFLHLP